MVLEASNTKVDVPTRGPMSRHIDLTSKVKSPDQVRSVDDCLDVVVEWIEKIAGKNFFMAPIEEFQQQYGKVNPEDEFYQSRMNYFLEWCVLERTMSKNVFHRAPISFFFESQRQLKKLASTTTELWMDFSSHRHSVFEVVNPGEDKIEVLDLWAAKLTTVIPKSGETLRYLRKGMIFQGFLFGHHDKRVLGQGLIIHPDRAYKQIIRFFKENGRSPRFSAVDICRNLASTNMRYLRMQHVDPTVIYEKI